jgi:hypothetical protein
MVRMSIALSACYLTAWATYNWLRAICRPYYASPTAFLASEALALRIATASLAILNAYNASSALLLLLLKTAEALSLSDLAAAVWSFASLTC